VNTSQTRRVHARTARRQRVKHRRAEWRKRKSKQRARESNKRSVVPVESNDALCSELIKAGYLNEKAQDDRVAEGEAISRFLDFLMKVGLDEARARIQQFIDRTNF
jgi:hypothetical protein